MATHNWRCDWCCWVLKVCRFSVHCNRFWYNAISQPVLGLYLWQVFYKWSAITKMVSNNLKAGGKNIFYSDCFNMAKFMLQTLRFVQILNKNIFSQCPWRGISTVSRSCASLKLISNGNVGLFRTGEVKERKKLSVFLCLKGFVH